MVYNSSRVLIATLVGSFTTYVKWKEDSEASRSIGDGRWTL